MKTFLSAEELRNTRVLPQNLPGKAPAKCSGLADNVVSEHQLDLLLVDRATALSEPKVERLNSLIRGEWLPGKRAVRIVKHVGKHLQHMGFTVDAQRLLHPEEALYLMDTKCMEVCYKNVTLSEQEAYAAFFVCEADLHKYLVYAHLSRLGYVVVRHERRSAVSNYERAIKLDEYLKHSRKTRHNSHGVAGRDEFPMEAADGGQRSPISRVLAAEESGTLGDERNRDPTPDSQPCLLLRHPEIAVPNAYGKSLFALLAAKPPHLPPNVQMRKEMYLLDLRKLYWKPNMASKRRRRRENVFVPGSHSFHGSRQDRAVACRTSRKREHQDSEANEVWALPTSQVKSQAKSWKEYKREAAGCKAASVAIDQLGTPNVTPLMRPEDASSTASILSRLQIIKSVNVSESISPSDSSDPDLIDLTYDVYLPTAEYRKNGSMLPNHRLAVTSALDPLPQLGLIASTTRYLRDGVPIHFAIVNNGDVAFYSFKDVRLPVLVSMG